MRPNTCSHACRMSGAFRRALVSRRRSGLLEARDQPGDVELWPLRVGEVHPAHRLEHDLRDRPHPVPLAVRRHDEPWRPRRVAALEDLLVGGAEPAPALTILEVALIELPALVDTLEPAE